MIVIRIVLSATVSIVGSGYWLAFTTMQCEHCGLAPRSITRSDISRENMNYKISEPGLLRGGGTSWVNSLGSV